MANGDRSELGWPDPPGSYTEELEDGVFAIHTGPITDDYVQRLWDAIAAEPANVAVRERIARILTGTGKHEDALEQWREILRLEPENRYAWSSAASCLREMGRPHEAVHWYRRALAVAPADPSSQGITRWGLAEALRDAGEREAARRELATAVDVIHLGVQREAASPHLLQHLRDLLTAWDDERTP